MTKGTPQQVATDAALDDLLSRWHQHFKDSVGRGYNRRSLVCGDYRTSRQYDDSNGSLDANIEHSIMLAVDFQVTQMRDPHKAAIYVQARALAIGVSVFNSPRLPLDRAEREIVIRDAREILVRRLNSAGLI